MTLIRIFFFLLSFSFSLFASSPTSLETKKLGVSVSIPAKSFTGTHEFHILNGVDVAGYYWKTSNDPEDVPDWSSERYNYQKTGNNTGIADCAVGRLISFPLRVGTGANERNRVVRARVWMCRTPCSFASGGPWSGSTLLKRRLLRPASRRLGLRFVRETLVEVLALCALGPHQRCWCCFCRGCRVPDAPLAT